VGGGYPATAFTATLKQVVEMGADFITSASTALLPEGGRSAFGHFPPQLPRPKRKLNINREQSNYVFSFVWRVAAWDC
jgi:hypothetical protein